MADADNKNKRMKRAERKEERERYLKQIDRGLVDVQKELKRFTESYSKLVSMGADVDDRLVSWSKFFNEISLVSEEREDDKS